MITVLILTNNFIGLYSFRKEVLKALTDRGYKVIISAPFDEKTEIFKEIGYKIIETPFNRRGINPVKDIGLILRYRRLLKKVRPDIVLSYTIKPNLYGGMACRFCKVPQIANITGLGSAVENPGILQLLTILLYRIGLKRTNTVFFQNSANRQFCLDHRMVKGYNRLIPGSGVNLEYHSLQEYPSLKGPLKFVFISRLIKQKGIEEYFQAAESIKGKYPDTEFHIVGWCDNHYSKRLKDLDDKGIVVYHGPVGDVRPMIGMAHCTIHPSFYPEGMSNVLLESCASGRPIITTNRPGCGEIIDNGVNGFIVKQQDPEDLIDKIELFIQLPYELKRQMGLAARNKVEKEFDRQIVVNAYLTEISSIVNV